MTIPRTVTVTLTAGQVRVLEKLVNLAIGQWPIHISDVDDDLIGLQRRAYLACQELDR